MSSRFKVAAVLLFVAFLVLSFAPVLQADTVSVAIGIDPETMDPVQQGTTLVAMMLSHVTETLVYMDPDGEIHPHLAEDWSISDDNREYTFYIREGVEFHDGSELNAEAVKFSLDRIINPDISTPLIGFYGPMSEVEVVDEYTVTVKFDEPFAPALMGFAWPTAAIISPQTYEEVGIQDFARHPVGTGPFEMTDWRAGERLIMERNENYWGETALPERIEWVVVPEPGTRTAMVIAGDVDIAYQPPSPDIPRLEADPGVELHSVPSTRIMHIALNNTLEPLDDYRVRQALNYAVDSQAIAESILMGAGTPNDAPLPDVFFGYQSIGEYDYDPDRARELLAEAGYEDGLELKFIHPSGRYILDVQVSETIQSFLADVGIEVNLETMDWPTYQGMISRSADEADHHMALLGWGPLPDAHHVLYSMFHSSQHPPAAFNLPFYDNEEFDSLIEEASETLDEETRIDLYYEAQSIVWEEAPWIFLYTQNMVLGIDQELEGVVIYPWEMFSLTGAQTN